MMQELNEMLEARRRGEDPDFEEFMQLGTLLRPRPQLARRPDRAHAAADGAMRQLMESMSADSASSSRG